MSEPPPPAGAGGPAAGGAWGRAAAATRAFAAAVGEGHVCAEGERLRAAERATFRTTHRIPAIVSPADRAEVQACLRVANEYRVGLHPVSGGKNWGNGSRVPFADGVFLLDLGRMRRILGYDEKLGIVTLEPGVTFGDLVRFLDERASPFFANLGGTSTEASVVGNASERGTGKSRYGDRAAAAAGFEVVLPTGEAVETGYGRYGGARLEAVTRFPIGPLVEGLFTQSSLGVITRMSVWLPKRPRVFNTFFYTLEDDALERAVDAVQSLYDGGVLQTPVLFGNDYRWLSFIMQYPYERVGGRTPLPRELALAVRREAGRGAWNGDGALYCESQAHARALREVVRRRLRGAAKVTFWTKARAELEEARLAARGEGDEGPGRASKARILRLSYRESLYLGVPVPNTLATTYWRKRGAPPADPDPDRDGVGMIAYDTCVPARGDDARRAVAVASRLSEAHGFEPNLAFNFGRDRSIYLTGQLLFDRDEPGQDERALACYREVVGALAGEGYFPYRGGVMSAPGLPEADRAYRGLLWSLKRALDPNGVLSPGKFEAMVGPPPDLAGGTP